jgi:hypothetical protein
MSDIDSATPAPDAPLLVSLESKEADMGVDSAQPLAPSPTIAPIPRPAWLSRVPARHAPKTETKL